jgi:hypothetical protein
MAGFNRWMVPPAALCIHLCIGMAYGFSVFWLPLTRVVGLDRSNLCPDDFSLFGVSLPLVRELFAATCDWHAASLG